MRLDLKFLLQMKTVRAAKFNLEQFIHRQREAMGRSEPAHHPLDAHYYSVVDEPQLS
jgi:hypothetical protein